MLVLDEITVKDSRNNMGRWCAMLRKQHKMSQIDLANELGMSHKTVANLENGKNFTIDTFLKVLKHFGKQNIFHSFIAQQLDKELESTNISFY